MDANEFIAKLKANNSAKDSDLAKVFDEYKVILVQLQPKDRAPFSLNVLCVLCRNLDNSSAWRNSIDNKELLILSIDCVRETRAMELADRVKTLACIYHIHRHVVRQTVPIPPELILKISYMPFEVEAKHLLSDYSKTYWNILVDRLSYIERLRNKIPISKLLPKLTEDVIKVIEIYDTVQFCNNLIVFLVKKLHCIYNEKCSKELNQALGQIFIKLSQKDMKPVKKLVHKEIIEIYVKLNECLYVVAENASKTSFKDSPLDNIVRSCISIVGHSPDLFHCLQTFYSNSFCSILTANTHLTYSETVLNGLLVSIETTEKLGYGRAMLATYPFLNQFLRLYIEYNVANCSKKPWKDNFNIQIQEICLKLIQVLMKRLKNCNQLVKCDSCQVKSGLHDSLRLSFLVQNFTTVSLSQNISITDTLPLLIQIINSQYKILTELNKMRCVNYEKCFRKQQTDIHNTAISLNKAGYYEFSIKLFGIYLNHEINASLTERKNVSRALFNKSICELDCKLYDSALIDAFLSLVLAGDGLSSEKYMSLVMDIKAKELKSRDNDDDDEKRTDILQLCSVLDACEKALDAEMYGNIKPYLMDLKFSEFLKHEFAMYAKLWPSVTPISGVWRSLLELSKKTHQFTADDDTAIWCLYEVIVETPSVVRNLTSDRFKDIITELLEEFDVASLTPDLKVVYASLLFLKTEFDLATASLKYGWKRTEPIQNSEQDSLPINRTVMQEYAATKSAIQAVEILAEMSPDFNTVSNKRCLQNSLHIYQVFVQLLVQLSRDVEGLQLARICCFVADCVNDKEAFVRNAGTLLYHGEDNQALQSVVSAGAVASVGLKETALVFLCDASIYYSKCGSVGIAARLVQIAQAQILAAYEDNPEINLDLAVGRLMEAQTRLCRDTGPSVLSAVNDTQRHYLSVPSTGSKWSARRLRSLTLQQHLQQCGAQACSAARDLRLWRRARAATALHSARACSAAAAHSAHLAADSTDVCAFNDAQINIDSRIKHTLGLPSNETQPHYAAADTKQITFTPKQEVEVMLDSFLFRKNLSPSVPCPSVPAFRLPDWFNHDSDCECPACHMPVCSLLACHAAGLEAAMYFRANENAIARNYFSGTRKLMQLTEDRLKTFRKTFLDSYEELVVESVMKNYWERYRRVKVEVLIEMSFFELKSGDYDVADEHIVEIHEILQEMKPSGYMTNDVMNLMTCSAQLRRVIKKRESLEAEFENLRLSPGTEPPKTPITKLSKPPKPTKMIVKDEEIPKKRKVIKLNLDEGSDEKEVKSSARPHFKVPAAFSAKHVLEAATPRNRCKPTVILTQPSEDTVTPVKDKTVYSSKSRSKHTVLLTQPSEDSETSVKDTTVYSTPKDITPDQFFTPITSIKTYVKKSLRHNIVKNLEQEFSTPIGDRENKKAQGSLQVPHRSKAKDKALKRATSPGKLAKETKELPRARRLRKPVNFSLDKDDQQ